MEELKNEIISTLKHLYNLNNDMLLMIDHALNNIMRNYQIQKVCNEVSIIKTKSCKELDQFLIRKEFKGLSSGTISQYRYLLNNFVAWLDKDVKNVTPNDIRAFLSDYSKINNASKCTMDNKRLILCSFYQFLHQNGYIPYNPAIVVEKIKFDKKVREPLSNLEIRQIRKACTSSFEEAVFETFFSTGCRVSEVVNMKISDIDFVNDQIKVCGKGNKERFVLLNTEAHAAIKDYLNSRTDSSPYLFVSNKYKVNGYNRNLSNYVFQKLISDLGERAHLMRHITPHVIRHTSITYWSEKGLPLDMIQLLAGHSKMDTTRIYLHTSMERTRRTYKNLMN